MPPKPKALSNLEAARSGDQRVALERLRDELAAALDAVDPAVVAQIAAQYRATLQALAEMGGAASQSKRDELAQRRRERRSS